MLCLVEWCNCTCSKQPIVMLAWYWAWNSAHQLLIPPLPLPYFKVILSLLNVSSLHLPQLSFSTILVHWFLCSSSHFANLLIFEALLNSSLLRSRPWWVLHGARSCLLSLGLDCPIVVSQDLLHGHVVSAYSSCVVTLCLAARHGLHWCMGLY